MSLGRSGGVSIIFEKGFRTHKVESSHDLLSGRWVQPGCCILNTLVDAVFLHWNCIPKYHTFHTVDLTFCRNEIVKVLRAPTYLDDALDGLAGVYIRSLLAHATDTS